MVGVMQGEKWGDLRGELGFSGIPSFSKVLTLQGHRSHTRHTHYTCERARARTHTHKHALTPDFVNLRTEKEKMTTEAGGIHR